MKVNIIKEFPLFPSGMIQLGWKEYEGGMTAGMEPMYCRLVIPQDEVGLYPDTWFPLRQKSQTKTMKSIEEGGGTIPKDILIDCYSYAWETLYRSSK